METIVYTLGRTTEITIAAGNSLAVLTLGQANVYQKLGYPNQPSSIALLSNGFVNDSETVFGPYASGATLIVESIVGDVFYEQGTAPLVRRFHDGHFQPVPNALNATGALTSAMILGGIATSTTAAAVAGTLPTGTALDAASQFAINDAFDWSLVNTGGNTFTVTAATDHTIVGVATVVTVTSGRFRTVKTAAHTFVTYRLA